MMINDDAMIADFARSVVLVAQITEIRARQEKCGRETGSYEFEMGSYELENWNDAF